MGLGIHIGNTNTSVAKVRANDNKIEVTYVTPSVVSYEKGNVHKIGEAALESAIENKGRVVSDF